MDGAFYHDSRTPFFIADAGAVTLAATYKALIPAGSLAPLGANYFGFPGKKVRIRVFGRMTTGATPGNVQIGLLYGTGADANGVTVCQSGAVALLTGQTNISFEAEFIVVCRTLGPTGTLFGTGKMVANPALIASTTQPLMIPASAPAASASVDLTSSSLLLSPQLLRSGSTAETAQIHDYQFDALS
jgi:hypothetical protein